jgi:hypothetical protein
MTAAYTATGVESDRPDRDAIALALATSAPVLPAAAGGVAVFSASWAAGGVPYDAATDPRKLPDSIAALKDTNSGRVDDE